MRRRLFGVALAGVLGLSGLAVPQAASAAPLSGDIVRVSTSAGGIQADRGVVSDDDPYSLWPVSAPSLSADGTKVAFRSTATNLSARDGKGPDVFVKDLVTGKITLASVPPGGGKAPDDVRRYPLPTRVSLSADGTKVAFEVQGIDDPGSSIARVAVKDLTTGKLVLADTSASNLVAGDTNGYADVFVRSAAAKERAEIRSAAGSLTTAIGRVSTSSSGEQADQRSAALPSMSADGRLVAFVSAATNLVPKDTNRVGDVFVKDLATGTVRRVSTTAKGAQLKTGSSSPAISADGTRVAFVSAAPAVPGDSNGKADVFVKNLKTGALARVSTAAGGKQSKAASYLPALSGGGMKVVFQSRAKDAKLSSSGGPRSVYLKDRRTGALIRVARDAEAPTISADGGTVAFLGIGSRTVPGYKVDADELDVFVRTLKSGKLVGASKPVRGSSPAGSVFGRPSLSANGRVVAFTSSASNLVKGDTNDSYDVFVRNLKTGAISLASASAGGVLSIAGGIEPVLSADGAKVAFSSDGPDRVANDDNFHVDVFVKTL